MTIEMQYSDKFKSRMVGKMTGPRAASANALSAEVGINQPTLSRWLREARTVSAMPRPTRESKKKTGLGRLTRIIHE